MLIFSHEEASHDDPAPFFSYFILGGTGRNKHIPPLTSLNLIPHCIHIFLPIFILSSGINQVVELEKK